MFRSFFSVALSSTLILSATLARAQGVVLLASDDPKQITQVDLAQVMASDSTHWLSVRLNGRVRLALVSAVFVEQARSGDAWLRALDFATRERIAAPPGPLAVCPERATFPSADSGLPEAATIAAQPATTANSELELQQALANAGIHVDLASVDELSADHAGPYQITWFDAPAAGGATAAVRWVTHASLHELPVIHVAGLDSVPVSVVALAKAAVLPAARNEADPSELGVTYFALSATSDYVTARASWLQDNADRWLVEAANTAALFDVTVFAGEAQIPAAVSRYFSREPAQTPSTCETQVTAAHGHASHDSNDFVCGDADDLAQALGELEFADVHLTRLFGSSSAPGAFVVASRAQQNPRLQATDFETKGCSPAPSAGQGGTVTPGNGMGTGTGTGTSTGAGTDTGTYTSGSESGTEVTTSVEQTSLTHDDGGCSVSIFSSSDDSCSGDSSSSSSSSSSSDSCSGNPSSDASSSSDSCSGNSSTDGSTADDSCSGNSDSSNSDSSGCGSDDKSGYNGDTCSGNSASSTAQGLSHPPPSRPRHVHLSLLTLLAAGLSLPLRRRVK